MSPTDAVPPASEDAPGRSPLRSKRGPKEWRRTLLWLISCIRDESHHAASVIPQLKEIVAALAPADPEGEPVVQFRIIHTGEAITNWLDCDEDDAEKIESAGNEIRRLYTHPPEPGYNDNPGEDLGWISPQHKVVAEPKGAREALERVRIALDGFGDGSLARIAKHFDMGSEEWAIIHNADESMSLADEAARAALAPQAPAQTEDNPLPDSDFCGKCHEHTGFERNEALEGEWFSECCGWPAIEMGE